MNLYHDNPGQQGPPYIKINGRLDAELDISLSVNSNLIKNRFKKGRSA